MFSRRDLTQPEVGYIAAVRDGLSAAPQEVRDRAAYYATTLMENGFPVLFDVAHLGYVTDTPPHVVGTLAARPAQFYSDFRIPKRAGGSRHIASPTPALKHLQRWIKDEITSRLEVHPACHGFVQGRSIRTNATPHVGAPLVLRLDLRDFFSSVTRQRVYRLFRRIGYAHAVAQLLTNLTTLDGVLPQGAPTSPDLANAAASTMDLRLTALCSRRDIAYTRYADDLTFSGSAVASRRTKRVIERIVRDEHFYPNEKKARYVSSGGRQLVTGLVVNEKVNWPRRYRRWLRQEVYYLQRFGVEAHLERRGVDPVGYKEFVYGHVYALNTVLPGEAQKHLQALDQVAWPY
jgi:retron-type reverse transcriptase